VVTKRKAVKDDVQKLHLPTAGKVDIQSKLYPQVQKIKNLENLENLEKQNIRQLTCI